MSQIARQLARFIFGRESISRRLETSRLVQEVAHRLHAREWINAALRLRPIRRHLDSGVKYLIQTFEALAVERSYFGNPIYTEIFLPNPPLTFIDLGCNSGIFPCLIAHLAGGREIRGLGIDANAELIELARKSAQLNHWPEAHFLPGLVGSRTESEPETDFYVHPTSLGSSQFPYADSESGRPADWKRVKVPNVKAGELWRKFFGSDQRCDCLKIDIEGSEIHFLQQERELLSRVDAILIEWHAWTTTPAEVGEILARDGFKLARTIEETPRHGILFFRRTSRD